jgi:hypothetical protein
MIKKIALLLAVLLLQTSAVRSQEEVAPLYALPADGAWVEYAWTMSRRGQKDKTGTLRLSCVGNKEVHGTGCRWVEFKNEEIADNGKKVHLRRLLIPLNGLTPGKSLMDVAVEAYAGTTAGTMTRLSGSRLEEFLYLGLGRKNATLRLLGEKEQVMTESGLYTACHFSASGRASERSLEYHVWLTAQSPFGWVKFELEEQDGNSTRRTFIATLAKTGCSAKSELDPIRVK